MDINWNVIKKIIKKTYKKSKIFLKGKITKRKKEKRNRLDVVGYDKLGQCLDHKRKVLHVGLFLNVIGVDNLSYTPIFFEKKISETTCRLGFRRFQPLRWPEKHGILFWPKSQFSIYFWPQHLEKRIHTPSQTHKWP
jgi:hypothetical protein